MPQIRIPRPLNFQETPRDLNRDQIVRRFFPRMRSALAGLAGDPNWNLLPPKCSAYQMVGGSLCGSNPYTGSTSGPAFVNPVTGGLSGPEGYGGPMRPALDSYYPGGAAAFGYHPGSLSMPANVQSGVGGRAFITYVNPDGTLGQSDDRMQYTAADASFKAPALAQWQQAVTSLGFAALDAQWQATYQSLVQQAQQALAANYPVATPIQTNPVTGAPGTTSGGTGGSATSATLTFTDPSGRDLKNLQLPIGQQWVIKITGALPNTAVMVTGAQNGVANTNSMGTTDGSGNWQATGSTDSSTVGNWTESWSVGNQNVGSFMFSVNQGSAPIGGSQGTGSALPGSASSGSSSSSGSSTSATWISGIPNEYVMIGGGALALLLLMGGRR